MSDEEGESTSNAEQKQGAKEQDISHIELIRVIDRTIHVSSIDRKKEVDFVVLNNSDEKFNYLYLPLREFERNLQVQDEDGKGLNIYPNSKVKKWLDSLKEEDKEGYERMEHRFKHADYKLYIQLPPDKPLEPNKLRTIRLTFEESDPVEFYSIMDPSIFTGWIDQWEKKFFKVPSFVADVERFPGHPHDDFVVVVSTSGYAATGASELEGGVPEEEVYENGLNDDTRVFSVRLPPAEERRYTGDIQYDLIPNNRTLMFGLAIYWVLAVVSGTISVLFPTFDLVNGYAGIGQTISAGFITVTIGLIFALEEDWANR
jgi:hypothetical protein